MRGGIEDGPTAVPTTAAPRTAASRLRAATSRGRRAEPASVLLAVLILAWCAVFGRLIWGRHAHFATFDFDLGHHDQALWLLAHGKSFVTVSGMPVLGHHMTLAYFGVVPLYWLGGGPQMLNLLQTAALGLSTVPIYLFARDRLRSPWQALAFGGVWLLNPSVQWLCWEAWHPETMAIPFLLTAYLLASRRSWLWYGIALVLALAWKEDVALAVAVLGLALVVTGERRIGLWTFALGAGWFLVAYGAAMPHFNGGTNHAGTFYGELGSSPTEMVRTALTNPSLVIDRMRNNNSLAYARDLLTPFGFVPLAAPAILVIAIPQFLANSLATADFFYDIRYHYVAIILVALALASVEGVARFRNRSLRRSAVAWVGVSALATSIAWGLSPIGAQYRSGVWPLTGNARQQLLDAAVAAVPASAAVAATYNIVPHLSQRPRIYTFPNPWIRHNWGIHGVAPNNLDREHAADQIDWIVVDRTTHTPGSREEVLLDRVLTDGTFETLSEQQGIVLARRVGWP